jgi:hypothetical protein
MLHFWQIFFYYYKEYVILFYTRFYSTSIFVLIERIWTVFECVLPGYTVTRFCKTAKHLNPICELLSTWFHGFSVPKFLISTKSSTRVPIRYQFFIAGLM